MKALKAFEIIFVLLMVVCSIAMTIWQVAQNAPFFVVLMLFLTSFFTIAALISIVKECYDKK